LRYNRINGIVAEKGKYMSMWKEASKILRQVKRNTTNKHFRAESNFINSVSKSDIIAFFSIRMSKSDLKARPIFHQKRDSIEAHLTIVFTALAISRYIEAYTEVSIKRFIRILGPIRSGIVSVGEDLFYLKANIPETAQNLLNKLPKC